MDNFMVMLIPIVSVVGSFIMVVAIVYFISRAKERSARYRADVQMKMIERFGSANEFTQFLESSAGKQFLNETPRRSARERAMGGIRTGIILTFIGLGFCVGYWAEGDPGFFIPAFILIGLGVGFLISAAVSWKMAAKWDSTQAQ
ncbi:MAG TPA: DUF6249 domain-containing protein [Thermoanaerobaculia bacterium]|nr:DUF6249 domain-containing protein [Thermoanaerobaculia bacterium]